MKTLEKGQDKIQKICDKIRHETIEPAKKEAQLIIAEAKKRAEEIIKEGENQAEEILKQARGKVEQERGVFHSALQQAGKQALEYLRQEIELNFFNKELEKVLGTISADPQVIALVINGLVKAIEKEGMGADLMAVIPKSVSPEKINTLLLDEVKKKLAQQPMEIGHFNGGAQVKLVGRKMTLDLTDQALKELLANYMRKDFRQFIFNQGGQ